MGIFQQLRTGLPSELQACNNFQDAERASWSDGNEQCANKPLAKRAAPLGQSRTACNEHSCVERNPAKYPERIPVIY